MFVVSHFDAKATQLAERLGRLQEGERNSFVRWSRVGLTHSDADAGDGLSRSFLYKLLAQTADLLSPSEAAPRIHAPLE